MCSTGCGHAAPRTHQRRRATVGQALSKLGLKKVAVFACMAGSLMCVRGDIAVARVSNGSGGREIGDSWAAAGDAVHGFASVDGDAENWLPERSLPKFEFGTTTTLPLGGAIRQENNSYGAFANEVQPSAAHAAQIGVESTKITRPAPLTEAVLAYHNRPNNHPALLDSPHHGESRIEEPGHDHEHEEESHLSPALIGSVVAASICILLAKIVGALLPGLLTRVTSPKCANALNTILMGFASGALWGLALVHVLVEAIDSLRNLDFGLHLGEDNHLYNAAYPLIFLGYISMLAIHQSADLRMTSSGGSTNLAAPIIACVALSCHAVAEGLIVGLRDSVALVWICAASILGHEWAASFALAQSIAIAGASSKVKFTLLGLYAVATPIGSGIGLALAKYEETPMLGIVNALSCGVLIQVAVEVTESVFGAHNHGSHTTVSQSPAAKTTSRADNTILDYTDPETTLVAVSKEPSELSSPHHTDSKHAHHSLNPYLSAMLGFIAMTAGCGLIYGMMCLHMSNPGHEH